MQKEIWLIWMEQLTLGFCCLFSDLVDELNVSHGKLLQPLPCFSLITSHVYTLSTKL